MFGGMYKNKQDLWRLQEKILIELKLGKDRVALMDNKKYQYLLIIYLDDGSQQKIRVAKKPIAKLKIKPVVYFGFGIVKVMKWEWEKIITKMVKRT